MDEKKVNNTISNAANNAAGSVANTDVPSSSTTTTTTSRPVYTLSDPERVKAINDMYDATAAAQRTALQESGDQALSQARENRDKIAQTYQTQRNMAAVNWERQRRNFMEGANMSGVNTGAGAQAELHMMGQQQRTQNDLGSQQAQAEAAADRNIADIQRQTQAAINEAIAKNDYQRAAALLSEYNQIYTRATQKAQALAQYGDFSGYGAIYGDESALKMAQSWYVQNPDLAYRMGAITKDQYDNIKGSRPINEGLDGSGTRIRPVYGGGGGVMTGASPEYLGYLAGLKPDNGNPPPAAAPSTGSLFTPPASGGGGVMFGDYILGQDGAPVYLPK